MYIKRAAELSVNYRSQSIDRAIGILRLLEKADGPLDHRQVARLMAMHEETTRHYLIILMRHGLVARTVKARYLIAKGLVLP